MSPDAKLLLGAGCILIAMGIALLVYMAVRREKEGD